MCVAFRAFPLIPPQAQFAVLLFAVRCSAFHEALITINYQICGSELNCWNRDSVKGEREESKNDATMREENLMI